MPSDFRGNRSPSRLLEGLVALLVGGMLVNGPLAGPIPAGLLLREAETTQEGSEEVDEGGERVSFSTSHRPTIPRRTVPHRRRGTPAVERSVGPVDTASSDRATVLEERTLCLRR